MNEILSIEEWANHRLNDKPVNDESIVCAVSNAGFQLMLDDALVNPKAVDQESLLDGGQMRHIISDESVDRHGDIVRAKGWDISNYKKNPVILWAHDRNNAILPIGKSLRIIKRMKEKQLVSIGEYPSASLYEFANTAFRLAVNGFLNAVSVGFMPKEWKAINEEEPWTGYDITKQELWEYSLVPVPANPNALQNAANSMPGGAAFIRRWAEEILDTVDNPDDHKELKVAAEAKIIKATIINDDGTEEDVTHLIVKDGADGKCEEFTEIAEITSIEDVEHMNNMNTQEIIDNEKAKEAEEEDIVKDSDTDDPIIFTLVAEPTFNVEESAITNMVADAVTRVTGRLIDREE